jgi:putative transposase
MIRTVYFKCELSEWIADLLNAESGRIYSQVMVEQYRIFRHSNGRIWLSGKGGERLNDFYNRERPAILHSHSIDAAQQGFYKACKTAKAAKKANIKNAKYPHKRKRYRTIIWKNTTIKAVKGQLRLSLAEGIEPLWVELPEPLKQLPTEAFAEVRLKFNKVAKLYEWHVVYEDHVMPDFEQPGMFIAAGDMGEIHPITVTDGEETVVVSCRQLRAENQRTNKTLASIQKRQARLIKGSRKWWRLERRKRRFLEEQKYRKRDLQHKISREVVDWCRERRILILAIGDVRNIADGKRLHKKSQQKISNWSHGKLRRFIAYKAQAAGITVIDEVNEAYTSQTCVGCGH